MKGSKGSRLYQFWNPEDPNFEIACNWKKLKKVFSRIFNVNVTAFDMKFPYKMVGWLVLWCLTMLSTIFQLYRGASFIGGGNRRTRSKPPTCRKSLYRIMLYISPWSRLELATSVVIGTDCIGSCKFNYHTIIPNLSLQIYAASHITHLSLRWNGKTLYLAWSNIVI